MGNLNINSLNKSTDTGWYILFIYLFIYLFNLLPNIIVGKTCFKVKQGASVDGTLTNRPKNYQKPSIIKTGTGNHHNKPILAFFRSYFKGYRQ